MWRYLICINNRVSIRLCWYPYKLVGMSVPAVCYYMYIYNINTRIRAICLPSSATHFLHNELRYRINYCIGEHNFWFPTPLLSIKRKYTERSEFINKKQTGTKKNNQKNQIVKKRWIAEKYVSRCHRWSGGGKRFEILQTKFNSHFPFYTSAMIVQKVRNCETNPLSTPNPPKRLAHSHILVILTQLLKYTYNIRNFMM